MMKLHIDIEISTPLNPNHQVQAIAEDTVIPLAVADALAPVLAQVDLSDLNPGNGVAEFTKALHVPVKLNFLFIHLNQTVELDAIAKISLVRDAA